MSHDPVVLKTFCKACSCCTDPLRGGREDDVDEVDGGGELGLNHNIIAARLHPRSVCDVMMFFFYGTGGKYSQSVDPSFRYNSYVASLMFYFFPVLHIHHYLLFNFSRFITMHVHYIVVLLFTTVCPV